MIVAPFMLTATIAFFLGVLLAPVVKPLFRPLLVELIKLVLLTSEEVKRLSAQVKEDVEDATAEAQAQRAKDAQRASAQAPSAPADSKTETPPSA